jgi:hypothetical protein
MLVTMVASTWRAVSPVSLACKRPNPVLISGGKTLRACMYKALEASSTACKSIFMGFRFNEDGAVGPEQGLVNKTTSGHGAAGV